LFFFFLNISLVLLNRDLDLQYQFGAAMATEQIIKGTNILLGPMINIARVPQGGRNFESYGEVIKLFFYYPSHTLTFLPFVSFFGVLRTRFSLRRWSFLRFAAFKTKEYWPVRSISF
jgi:hypothetical protein